MDWLTFFIALTLGLLWGVSIGRSHAKQSAEDLLKGLLAEAVGEVEGGGSYYLTICLSNKGEGHPLEPALRQNWEDQ